MVSWRIHTSHFLHCCDDDNTQCTQQPHLATNTPAALILRNNSLFLNRTVPAGRPSVLRCAWHTPWWRTSASHWRASCLHSWAPPGSCCWLHRCGISLQVLGVSQPASKQSFSRAAACMLLLLPCKVTHNMHHQANLMGATWQLLMAAQVRRSTCGPQCSQSMRLQMAGVVCVSTSKQ
jgi:hypothetical protein